MTEFARDVIGSEPLIVDHRLNVGVKLLYHRPEEMGADRLVNAAYAYQHYGASIIVDFGTATTFDVINAAGEYLGGCITPGIRISMDALFAYAARLPRIEVARPVNTIGRSTEEAMRSGVYYGYVAMVDGLVRRLAADLNDKLTVIATGGLATLIARDATTIDRVEPNLTLESLRLIFYSQRGDL
jgi:type III pantothenate kinase